MLFAAAALSFASLAGSSSPAPVTVYSGAKVWSGNGFRRMDLTVADGRFVSRAPRGAVVRKIDATGHFIVPAYANAHCHLTNATKDSSDAFLKAGVFYVWNPNSIVLGPEEKAFFARLDTYDVKIAQGGITEPGGHPEQLYVEFLSKYVYPGRKLDWFLGNAFHYGRNEGEIATALDKLVEQKADFVKALLVHSEEYAARRDDRAFYGLKGLNPANLPVLVREAKRRRLPVMAHVDSVPDLLTAAKAGVTIAGHLPGYGGNTEAIYQLSSAQAKQVVRTGMWLTPTFSVGASRFEEARNAGKPDPRQAMGGALQRDNIIALKRAKGTFLMGTDGRGPIFDEAEHWVKIGAFTSKESARVVFETGQRLFPERRIGCFRPGCEADFLVLEADPTADITRLRSIRQAVKAGQTVWSAN